MIEKGRIRVLHLIQNLNYGGMERLLADLVRHLDADRIESHIMALQYLGRFSEGLEDVATLHLADPLPWYSMLWPDRLIDRIRQVAPDIVHTHSGVWYKGAIAARRAGVGFLLHTDHGRQRPDPWLNRFLDGLAARRTDLVVAVSDALAQQLTATVVHHSDRVRVILNGVDTTAHRPRRDNGLIRGELGIGADVPIIGSIGRLEWIKGFDVMIEAFAVLRRNWCNGPGPVLVVAGDGSRRHELEGIVARHGLADAVRLLGWRDDVADLHRSFSLFTMASRSEGTSVSLLEAMSAGLCPVVTEVGGNAAVLGEELRHRLVPGEDPTALARAWSDALSNPRAREEDGRRARMRVEEQFGVVGMARRYEEIYLARGRSGADMASKSAGGRLSLGTVGG